MQADVEAFNPRVISLMDLCVEAEGGFLKGCEPRFDQLRNHNRVRMKQKNVILGALYPSKSGLMNKHIVPV